LQGAYFCKHLQGKLACESTHKRRLAISGKEQEDMGYKGWMLVWAGVSVSAVLCVYAAVWN
jgi:hypothetical protein